LRHPLQREFEMSAAVITPMAKLKKLLSEEKKPCFSAKYKHLQATAERNGTWSQKQCAVFSANISGDEI